MLQRLFDRIGFRGCSLILYSVVWWAVGLRIVTRPDPDLLHKLPLEYFPIWLRVALWWGPALIAIITVVWPPGKTKWGFVALIIPAAVRALSYLVTGALATTRPFWDAPGLDAQWGYSGAWVDGIVWAGITGYILVLSAWPEPPRGDPEPGLNLPEIPPLRSAS